MNFEILVTMIVFFSVLFVIYAKEIQGNKKSTRKERRLTKYKTGGKR